LSITLLILPANESRKIDRPVMLHVTWNINIEMDGSRI
jgi:hypothetical protein